jgi:hypothetical protein
MAHILFVKNKENEKESYEFNSNIDLVSILSIIVESKNYVKIKIDPEMVTLQEYKNIIWLYNSGEEVYIPEEIRTSFEMSNYIKASNVILKMSNLMNI